MRGLTILVAIGDAERLHAALTFAAAAAASGMAVRVHLHEGAVALLRGAMAAPGDAARAGNGLPTLPQILDDALTLGAQISLCQGGLALTGLGIDQVDPRITAQGPLGLLTTLGDDRLVVF